MDKCKIKDCELEGTRKIKIDIGSETNGIRFDDSIRIQEILLCDEHHKIIEGSILLGSLSIVKKP